MKTSRDQWWWVLDHESKVCTQGKRMKRQRCWDLSHLSVCLWAVCVSVCLWLRMLTAAEVPADDDREGQQRLRLPISGADRVSQRSQLFTPALAPAACPALRRGLRRIEQAICSLFLPLYCRVKLVFFKASTWGWSFWDYVPNTDSSTFILHVSPSRSAFFPPPPLTLVLFIYLPHWTFFSLSLSFYNRKVVEDKHT